MPKFLRRLGLETDKQRRKRRSKEDELSKNIVLEALAAFHREVPSVTNVYNNTNHAAKRQTRSDAIVNYTNGSVGDGQLLHASEAVKSLERVACVVLPEVLFTIRHLGTVVTIIVLAVVAAYCLLELGPPILVFLSRLSVDLPLAILNAICDFLALVFVRLPLAIVCAINDTLTLVVVHLPLAILGKISDALAVVFVQYPLAIGNGVVWVAGSVLNFISMCIILPFAFVYNIAQEASGFLGKLF